LIQRNARMMQRYLDGWKGIYGDSLLMPQTLVAGAYSPTGFVADWWSLGLRLCEAATGQGLTSDEGLDFVVDAAAEAAGPRYVDLPVNADPSQVALNRIVLAPGAAANNNTLVAWNVVLRVEDGRLAVSLVQIGRLQPVQSGTYHLTIGGIQGITKMTLSLA
jgi:hypothetical protein